MLLVHFITNKNRLNFSSNLLHYYQDKRHNQPTKPKRESWQASRQKQETGNSALRSV